MTASSKPLTSTLRSREFLHFEPGRRVCLRAEAGTLWVTVDGSPEDVEIEAGSSRSFEPRAPMIVGTIGGPAVVSWSTAGRPGWRERLAAAWQRPAWHFEMA